MGAYLSEPVTETFPHDEHSNRFSYGVSSMQGWRVSQEDAHNCILDFDDDTSFFAVYDGHGGADVAKYCSLNLPNFLKKIKSYQSGNVSQGLEDAFLNFDQTLRTPEVVEILKQYADLKPSSDEDPTEIENLQAEAKMPINEVIAKYGSNVSKAISPMLNAKTCRLRPDNDSENNSKSDSVENGIDDELCTDKLDTDHRTLENGINKDSVNSENNVNNKKENSKSMKSEKVVPECSGAGNSKSDTNKKNLRKKEPIMLLDSSEDDTDESDEGYNGNSEEESVENDRVDEDGNEIDDDDQWEDLDDDDDEEDEEEDESSGNIDTSNLEEPGMDSGCTAVVAVVKDSTLYVANAGDSRCVVCRSNIAVEMSCDHKPEDEIETNRIEAAGGQVTSDGRVNGGLNLSRAIGDHRYKQNQSKPPKEQMISALPDIQTLELDPVNDEFMVLACDGIWNTMSSQQVVDFVKERLNSSKKLSEICEDLFNHCLAPDSYGDGTGCDNMTALIVTFKTRSQKSDTKKKDSKHSSGTKRSAGDPEENRKKSSKKSKVE